MKAQLRGTGLRGSSEKEGLGRGRGPNHGPHAALIAKQKSPRHIFVYNSKTENSHLGRLTPMETTRPLRPESSEGREARSGASLLEHRSS